MDPMILPRTPFTILIIRCLSDRYLRNYIYASALLGDVALHHHHLRRCRRILKLLQGTGAASDGEGGGGGNVHHENV